MLHSPIESAIVGRRSAQLDAIDSVWPRLCQNAVFIIMCQSQWQGKPNEAFH
jgi:hypothetical protein